MGATKLLTAGGGGVTLDAASTATDKTITVPADNGTMALTSQLNGFRNRIINGGMVIDQRNAGASLTITTFNYGVDRFFGQASVTSKFTAQQSSTAPAGFVNSWLLTSSAATSPSSSDYYFISQAIEGTNCADLGWGTANAATVTLSFWVRSSVTGTFSGAFLNSAANRSYAFTYTINAANTWEQKSVTVAGDTSGTWLTTNGTGIYVRFALGAGSTYLQSANSWGTGNVVGATGTTNWISTSGATFYITGVQLEKGTVATGFDYRPYGTELALCQRYYARIFDPQMRGVGNGATTGGASRMALWLPVTMRAVPTAILTGTFSFWDGAVSYTGSTVAGYYYGGYNSLDMDINTSNSFTTGRAICAYASGDLSKYISVSAEL